MNSKGRIVVDPGHPSEVGNGCRGFRSDEVTVAWEIGKLLRDALRALHYEVRLTKSHRLDLVSNRDRARIATRFDADLMVRLHCDDARERGFAVYAPDTEGTDENGISGPSAEVRRTSVGAAAVFHKELCSGLLPDLANRGCHSDRSTAVGKRQGALTGSIHSTVPVVLVEMVVLTQRSDEAFILSPSGRRRMVDALRAGTIAAHGVVTRRA